MDIRDLDLDDDDVLVVHAQSLGGMQKYVELRQRIGAVLAKAGLAQWVNEQVQIEYLKTTGGGWKKGKVHIYLGFTPDQPEEPELADDPDSLDVLRRELNTD